MQTMLNQLTVAFNPVAVLFIAVLTKVRTILPPTEPNKLVKMKLLMNTAANQMIVLTIPKVAMLKKMLQSYLTNPTKLLHLSFPMKTNKLAFRKVRTSTRTYQLQMSYPRKDLPKETSRMFTMDKMLRIKLIKILRGYPDRLKKTLNISLLTNNATDDQMNDNQKEMHNEINLLYATQELPVVHGS
jgi:hypothetical protein